MFVFASYLYGRISKSLENGGMHVERRWTFSTRSKGQVMLKL